MAKKKDYVWSDVAKKGLVRHAVPVSGMLIQPSGLATCVGLYPRKDAQKKKWTGYAFEPTELQDFRGEIANCKGNVTPLTPEEMLLRAIFGDEVDEYVLDGKPHVKDRKGRVWTWDEVQKVLSSVPNLRGKSA